MNLLGNVVTTSLVSMSKNSLGYIAINYACIMIIIFTTTTNDQIVTFYWKVCYDINA